ncbi:hypothetical protein BpJC7_22690 [Weizmannia acidilactici]|uniref:CarD-like/TRCF RNAP-interacting domain-containing protein n=1 Tax=Weizmannia acidilactici TaxID=2607726 RepID=A0A5J4J7T2_9BACI|nr:CarD family transcriptional regulator [Weizmannia acidilactici]GER68295.1 hypothetical protein BpJC4_27660 [Weizmannia acidilactici]GER70966.1 hypothetical protein BpJC7_22690 [Weizmannia acidilactici]GER74585.1 hypothetical protein BpPP18_26520 [Weizmannia acidilactici]
MFHIGDLVIYSGQGICRVDDICDKTYKDMTKTYYVLHPIENSQGLTISIPIDNHKIFIDKLMNKAEAEKIIQSFASKGIDWIEKPQTRNQVFHEIVNSGNRMEIAKVANTLLRRKSKMEAKGKKFHESDAKLLTNIQDILFKELAIVLNCSYEEIYDKVDKMIHA